MDNRKNDTHMIILLVLPIQNLLPTQLAIRLKLNRIKPPIRKPDIQRITIHILITVVLIFSVWPEPKRWGRVGSIEIVTLLARPATSFKGRRHKSSTVTDDDPRYLDTSTKSILYTIVSNSLLENVKANMLENDLK